MGHFAEKFCEPKKQQRKLLQSQQTKVSQIDKTTIQRDDEESVS